MKNVLIIDDDEDFSYVFSLMLRTLNLSCDIVTSLEQALDLIEQNNFEAIFIDLMLKEKSGIEIAKAIKLKKISAKLIMLSAVSESLKDEVLRESGADYFLGKPVDRKNLQLLFQKFKTA